jgi:hypothetical protein
MPPIDEPSVSTSHTCINFRLKIYASSINAASMLGGHIDQATESCLVSVAYSTGFIPSKTTRSASPKRTIDLPVTSMDRRTVVGALDLPVRGSTTKSLAGHRNLRPRWL